VLKREAQIDIGAANFHQGAFFGELGAGDRDSIQPPYGIGGIFPPR
jgi:hypothetical protein